MQTQLHKNIHFTDILEPPTLPAQWGQNLHCSYSPELTLRLLLSGFSPSAASLLVPAEERIVHVTMLRCINFANWFGSEKVFLLPSTGPNKVRLQGFVDAFGRYLGGIETIRSTMEYSAPFWKLAPWKHHDEFHMAISSINATFNAGQRVSKGGREDTVQLKREKETTYSHTENQSHAWLYL